MNQRDFMKKNPMMSVHPLPLIPYQIRLSVLKQISCLRWVPNYPIFFCCFHASYFCRSSSLVALHARDGLLLVPPGHPVHWREAKRLLGDVHPPHCHPRPSHPQLEQSDASDGLPRPHGPRPGRPLDGAGQAVQIRRIWGDTKNWLSNFQLDSLSRSAVTLHLWSSAWHGPTPGSASFPPGSYTQQPQKQLRF